MRFVKQWSRCCSVWHCDQFYFTKKSIHTIYDGSSWFKQEPNVFTQAKLPTSFFVKHSYKSFTHCWNKQRYTQLVKIWLWKKERKKNWKAHYKKYSLCKLNSKFSATALTKWRRKTKRQKLRGGKRKGL